MNSQPRAAKTILWHPAAALLALFPLLTTGCLFAGGMRRVEFEEAERIPVKFSSAKAAHDFNEGMRQSDQEAYTDASGFMMPFLVARGEALYHETAHYNAEVRLADINRDGEITAEEAQAYLSFTERVAAAEDDQ